MWREIEFPLLPCVVSVSFDVKITSYDKTCYCQLTCQISDNVDNKFSRWGIVFDVACVVKTRILSMIDNVEFRHLKIGDVTATSLQCPCSGLGRESRMDFMDIVHSYSFSLFTLENCRFAVGHFNLSMLVWWTFLSKFFYLYYIN